MCAPQIFAVPHIFACGWPKCFACIYDVCVCVCSQQAWKENHININECWNERETRKTKVKNVTEEEPSAEDEIQREEVDNKPIYLKSADKIESTKRVSSAHLRLLYTNEVANNTHTCNRIIEYPPDSMPISSMSIINNGLREGEGKYHEQKFSIKIKHRARFRIRFQMLYRQIYIVYRARVYTEHQTHKHRHTNIIWI